jgi:hypothetical protein
MWYTIVVLVRLWEWQWSRMNISTKSKTTINMLTLASSQMSHGRCLRVNIHNPAKCSRIYRDVFSINYRYARLIVTTPAGLSHLITPKTMLHSTTARYKSCLITQRIGNTVHTVYLCYEHTSYEGLNWMTHDWLTCHVYTDTKHWMF